MSEKKSSGIEGILLHSLVGAFIAGLGFFPLTIAVASGLEFLLFNALNIGRISNADDFMIMAFCWLPAAVLGAFAGPIGATLVRKRSSRVVLWLGVAIGGLVAALVVALLMTGNIYAGWIDTYKEYQVREMRPKSRKPILSLKGNFQELTTMTEFESLAVSPDGQMLAYAANRQITLWDLAQNAAPGRALIGHTSTINSLDFSPDGRWLVSGSHDQKVIVWSVPAREQSLVLQGHRAVITSVAVSPDGELVASGDGDGIIILWNLTTGQEVARLETNGAFVYCLEFSPDGESLAVCAGDLLERAFLLWDVAQREPAGQLDLPSWSNGTVYGVSFSPDGNLLAGAATEGPVVWDVETRKPLGAVQEIDTLSEIDFSPDGRWIVSSGEAVYLWDVATREPVGKLVGPSADHPHALFLPDGRLLAWYWYKDAPTQIGVWTIETP